MLSAALQEVPLAPATGCPSSREDTTFEYPAEAARAYAEGLARPRGFDALGACERLTRAAELSPDHALVHEALAEALSQLGYDALARESATRALALSGSLGREKRLVIEGLASETAKNWPRAVEIHRALFTFVPDNLDYGLKLASAQLEGELYQDALATVAALRHLAAPAGDDPRIDLVEAKAQGQLSNAQGELAAATRAVTTGTSRGARFAVAEGLYQQGAAYDLMGRSDESFAAMTKAARRFHEMGDRTNEARALNRLAIGHAEAGDLAGAHRSFEAAQAAFKAVGNLRGVAAIAGNLGVLLRNERDLKGARRQNELGIKLSMELREQSGTAISLHNLAFVLGQMGELQDRPLMVILRPAGGGLPASWTP